MRRLSTSIASMKYAKQWIVMVNLEEDRENNKTIGDIYLVTPNKDEAYDKAIALGDSMGKNMVVRGNDELIQCELGGFDIWDDIWNSL